MTITFDYLNLRRMPIDYTSPFLCESNFSSTSEPSIVLEPWAPKRSPSGLLGAWTTNGIHFSWDVYPGALCYSIYKAVDALDPYGDYTIVAECVSDNDIILPVVDPSLDCGWFVITSLTPEGETEISDPIYVDCSGVPVCSASSISITSDSNFDPVVEGVAIVFTAYVTGSPPGDVTGTVTFYDGVTVLGLVPLTVPGAEIWEKSCSLSVNWLTDGNHTIKAIYNGDADNCLSVSSEHTQTIGPGCAPDCAPPDMSINPCCEGWGVSVDDGTALILGQNITQLTGSDSVFANLGYSFIYLGYFGHITYNGNQIYFEHLDSSAQFPGSPRLWAGIRCPNVDPNGGYTRVTLTPELLGPYQFWIFPDFPDYRLSRYLQITSPDCVEVSGIPIF